MLNDITNQKFVTFNVKFDDEKKDVEIETITAQLPDENVLFLIGKDLEYLWNFDIKNFNYVIFENDLELINDGEFEYFWKKFFLLFLDNLNENYLENNIEDFQFQLSNTYEKRFLVKKIIHFIMLFFPYYIFKDMIVEKEFENKNDAISYINFLADNEPKELRNKLISLMENAIKKSENFLNSIQQLSKFSKKNELEDSLTLLEDQLKKQDVYIKLFIEMINNTEIDKLKNLLIKYLEKDFENLAV